MELIKRWLKEATGVETELEHPTDGQFGDYATNVAMMLAKKTGKNPREVAVGRKGKTVVIDYSSPNIAKPFGIGHLRSTNIGQAIYNIYKILGWKCIGDNHLGDWGTQFGKLIWAIKHWATKPVNEMTIADLEELYVKFHQEAEKNEDLVAEARDWFF